MKKFLSLSLITLALVGCKTEMEKEISFTRLYEPLGIETAQLKVEVAACNDYSDSRQPSQSLVEAQQKIPFVFSNATFRECYREKFNSYAVFDIPISVGVAQQSIKESDTQDISLLSAENDKHKVPLLIVVKSGLKQRLNQLKRTEIMANSIDFSVLIKLKNDLKEDKNLRIISSYIDEKPKPDGLKTTFKANDNKTIKIKLSNVSIDKLMNGNETEGVSVIREE
ncbi:DUF7424 family protein [Ursidibacter sp. B-7004-1]